MIATIINSVAIIVGTALGLLAKKGLSKRASEIAFDATGVISLVIGISMAIKTEHILAFVISLLFGGLMGSAIGIEAAIKNLGEFIKKRFVKNDDISDANSSFAYGFLNASVLFCVGAMTILGCFKAGAEGDYSLLLTKSVMDGVMSIMFASTMGIGVGFSALSVLLYQGALTLLAVWVKPFVNDVMLNELSAAGGALVMMVGINLLNLKKIRTGDFLPALVLIVILSFFFGTIPIL